MSFNMGAEKLQPVERISVAIFWGGNVLFDTNPQAEIIRTSVDFFFHVAHICTFFLKC